eukprot:7858209-Alexandrium_andersonii.AAC.1
MKLARAPRDKNLTHQNRKGACDKQIKQPELPENHQRVTTGIVRNELARATRERRTCGVQNRKKASGDSGGGKRPRGLGVQSE